MKIRITKEIKIQGIVLKVGDVYEAKKTTSPTTHREAYEVEKNENFILVFKHECMENTPCNGCFENDYGGFEWRGPQEAGEGKSGVKRVITIPNRDSDGWLHGVRNVEVNWECPICGALMGEPVLRNYSEDGEFFYVHNWENPCGHLCKYGDLTPVKNLPPFYQKGRLVVGEGGTDG